MAPTTDESQESPDQLRIELERIEREIAELQQVAREIRERLTDDPGDGPDRAEALRLAEEQEAIAAVLEERREELQRRLAAS
jgi:uncharacterized protein (UPF0335 family)